MSYLERASYDWTEDSVRIINSPGVTAKSAYFYIQETGYFQTKRQYFTEREQLNSYLIVYTISGKGTLRYKNKSYTLCAGQAFFIDCMEYQYYETDKEDLWEMLWVHFNGATSRGYYEQFVKSCSPIVVLEGGPSVPPIMRQIIDVQRVKNIRAEIVSSKLLVQLLTEILLSANDHQTSDYFLPEYMVAMMNDLEKRFNEKITLDQLADQYTINKFHLAKEFKKYTGFTPNEYLINTRINFAKEWLQYSDLPVAEIAYRTGIDNVSHFINLFKQRVDMTPLVYRKKWQRPVNRRE